MTRYLADACALVGFRLGQPGFPSWLRTVMEDDADSVAVLAATVWELAIKEAKGGLPGFLDPSFPTTAAMLRAFGFRLLPLSPDTAELAARLPPHHRDPFDRMLVSQATIEGGALVSRDDALRAYGVTLVW